MYSAGVHSWHPLDGARFCCQYQWTWACLSHSHCSLGVFRWALRGAGTPIALFWEALIQQSLWNKSVWLHFQARVALLIWWLLRRQLFQGPGTNTVASLYPSWGQQHHPAWLDHGIHCFSGQVVSLPKLSTLPFTLFEIRSHRGWVCNPPASTFNPRPLQVGFFFF